MPLPVVRHRGTITRAEARKRRRSLLLFTDNGTRTSGRRPIDPASWYSRRYARGRTLCHPQKTLALLRGLENAFPICTVAAYDGKTVTQWEASDKERFERVIDGEVADIQAAAASGRFDELVVFTDHIGQSGAYARIPPPLQRHLDRRLAELGVRPAPPPPPRDANAFLRGLHDLALRTTTMQLGALRAEHPDRKLQNLVRLVLTVGIGLPQAASMYAKLAERIGFRQGSLDFGERLTLCARGGASVALVANRNKNKALHELVDGGPELVQRLGAASFADARRRLERIHFVGPWTALSYLLLHHKGAQAHAKVWVPKDVAVKKTVQHLFRVPLPDVDAWAPRALAEPAQMFFILQAFDKLQKRSPEDAAAAIKATETALQIRGLTNHRRVGDAIEYKAVFRDEAGRADEWLPSKAVFSWQRERFVQKWAARAKSRAEVSGSSR
jgi:hypothetical protein